jgi:subtilisin-like proprotein convertase family protein
VIDVTTFTLEDIASFTGPNGALTVTDLQVVAGSNNRKFDLFFDSQSAFGDYDLILGPDITDLLGNGMNQDNDSTNGEATDDSFTVHFTLSEAFTYESVDVAKQIRWADSAISELTIPDDFTITDVNLQMNILADYTGDLDIYLVHPLGYYISLAQFVGNGANFDHTIFDDEASTSILFGDAPFAGSYQPAQPLSWFDGLSAQGTWLLWIDNWGTYDNGWLTAWSLSFAPGGVNPPPPPTNQLPEAFDDFVSTDEEVAVVVDVLANDSDPDGNPLTVSAIEWSNGGTATINPDQTITFIPDADFFGTAMFGYRITDGQDYAYASVYIDVAAINDAPVANSDLLSTFRDQTLTMGDWTLSVNDTDADYDSLYVTSVGNAVNGQVTLVDGAIVFTPTPGFAGWASFDYIVTDGLEFATGHADVNVREGYYLTFAEGGTLTSSDGSRLNMAREDIVSLAVEADGSYAYRMFFDASDVGLSTAAENIDAFAFLDDGSILISTTGGFSVPTGYGGILSGGGEDILQFYPTSLGSTTIGYWNIYFDGSDVGLSGAAENVDAISVLPDGRLLISTTDAFSVPGVATGGADEDLLIFTPTSMGATTAGSWAMYFDGSDVGLGTNDGEDVDALYIRPSASGAPTLYFSTFGNFAVSGVSGANEDIFAFQPTRTGATTTGTFSPTLSLRGSNFGLANFNVDGVYLGEAPMQYLTGNPLSLPSAPRSVSFAANSPPSASISRTDTSAVAGHGFRNVAPSPSMAYFENGTDPADEAPPTTLSRSTSKSASLIFADYDSEAAEPDNAIIDWWNEMVGGNRRKQK